MKTELIAEDGTVLNLNGDVATSLNKSIAEIQDPSKRYGDFTKTIELPLTASNNAFFEHWFEVNIVTGSFNINRKTPIQLLVGGMDLFKGTGSLRLREIETRLENGTNVGSYKVEIYASFVELWFDIGESKLEDLTALSSYNHVYNRVNQVASWTAPIGSGYVYPLIDYGYNAFLTNYWKVEHIRPGFYLKTYWDAIFDAAGKTKTCPFENTNLFKSLFIPHNGDKFTMAASNLANYEFYVGDDGTSPANTKNLTTSGSLYNDWWSGDIFTSASSSYLLKYNDDTTNPFIDTGNVYDPTTGVVTIGQTGTYNFTINADFEIKLSAVPAGTVTTQLSVAGFWVVAYKLLLSTDGGATYSVVNTTYKTNNSSIITSSYQTVNNSYTFTASFKIGEKLKLLVHPLYSTTGYGLVFKDGGGNPITTGTATIDWRYRNTSTWKSNLATGDYVSGQTLDLLDAIPKDVKQKDFILSILRMFNLYLSQDPDNENNYIIETRDEFYSNGDTVNWEHKLAYNMPFVSRPANSDLNALTLLYKYKEDQDYYNKKYFDANSEVYGTHKEILDTDFAKQDVKTELIFSPTLIVDNPNNSMIIPKIFSYDGTNVKPQKHNIRILMFNGVDALTGGSWTYEAPTGDALGSALLSMTTYPQCGMVDDPLNPGESIEFGVPNEVFYTTSNYTNNNLVNRFYYRWINEIMDRDSRSAIGYFDLRPSDIFQFDFRNKVFFKDSFWIVNKIIDYNVTKDSLTKVEFLSLKNYDAFEPETSSISALVTNSGNTGISAFRFGNSAEETNIGNANNVLIGENNYSRSVGSFISGSRNTVGPSSFRVSMISTEVSNVSNDCYGINMIGCSGNNVGAGCSGIVLTNCNNVTIQEYVYDFVGTSLNNETITTAMSGTTRVGKLTTFEGTGNTF